jgi:hypothetical protein
MFTVPHKTRNSCDSQRKRCTPQLHSQPLADNIARPNVTKKTTNIIKIMHHCLCFGLSCRAPENQTNTRTRKQHWHIYQPKSCPLNILVQIICNTPLQSSQATVNEQHFQNAALARVASFNPCDTTKPKMLRTDMQNVQIRASPCIAASSFFENRNL